MLAATGSSEWLAPHTDEHRTTATPGRIAQGVGGRWKEVELGREEWNGEEGNLGPGWGWLSSVHQTDKQIYSVIAMKAHATINPIVPMRSPF